VRGKDRLRKKFYKRKREGRKTIDRRMSQCRSRDSAGETFTGRRRLKKKTGGEGTGPVLQNNGGGYSSDESGNDL